MWSIITVFSVEHPAETVVIADEDGLVFTGDVFRSRVLQDSVLFIIGIRQDY